MSPSRAFPLAAALAALALAAIPAAAQTVTGTLLEPGGQPVEQVLVALVDNTGHQRAATLTDRAGAFTIRAPGAGRYSLRAERIGYTTVVSAAFDLRDGETRSERLVASGRAVALQAIRVSASGRRCTGRPERAAETATLWEEARKALNATAYGERERLYRYDVVRWTRDLDARTGAVTRDLRQVVGRVADHPFVSAPPAELSRHGFIRAAQGDSTFYWGPDAEVMLSDEFMNDHCFHVTSGPDSALVGLAFEPVRGRAVPDLAGVMWLDRRTAELRRVEYRYVGGPPESESPRVGGTVEYARLRNGPWIVSRWAIRMPLLQESDLQMSMRAAAISRNADTRLRVVAVRENGGEVTGTAGGDGRLLSGPVAAVQGVVWDSTHGAPLAGARVYFSGTQAETVAGADGRFRLEAPAEGTYTLAFTHAGLGPVAASAAPKTVTLKAGETVTADLAVPGWATVAAALCPDSTLHPNRGILLGTVRGAEGDTALVSATWTRTIVGGRETRSNTQFVATRPDPQGFYVLCGVPEGRPLQLGMRRRGVDLGGTEVRLQAGVPHWQDISADARAAEADLGEVKAVAAAAGVTVREADAPAAPRGLADFERRRHSGRGVYLAREEVERRHASRLVDLFRGLPGVQVVRDPAGERVVMTAARGGRWSDDMRAAPAGADTAAAALNQPRGDRTRVSSAAAAPADGAGCPVQLYVDGVFTPVEGGRIADEVQPGDVEAVEVYRAATEVPAEYRRQGSGCGVVLVWTRRYARTH
ncbi:carboxypeptidase regulatory-like domain-containing protein [Longimicrobium sp.]|uniref:carboxypeptidase regulatory-like domain-containing protein n=1 Tax=Longimicrobium sp. TaxID=2029185 RepID=UPI002C71D6C1|nr:carboxypeptidase regulatory-like domain-containing protein [Longimicrobium sp.]HSU15435.1 carboxypeptidase regulatory-like domain-containing protein [Longimicrobium sp.]